MGMYWMLAPAMFARPAPLPASPGNAGLGGIGGGLAKRARFQMRESDLRGHLINEIGIEDDAVEKDARDDPRFQQTAEELEEQGIEDFQLHYALQTLRRTSPMNIAARAK